MTPPEVELILLESLTVRPGEEIFGTVAVTAVEPTSCEKLLVRLYATLGRGPSDFAHELTVEELYQGEFGPGRHELPFVLKLPEDLATYTGSLFSFQLLVDATLHQYPEPISAEPKSVNVAPDGALVVQPKQVELVPFGEAGDFKNAKVVLGAGALMLLFLIIFPETLWLVGFVGLVAAGMIAQHASKSSELWSGRPTLRTIQVEVVEQPNGISVLVEVFAKLNVDIAKIRVALVASETIQGSNGLPVATSRGRQRSEVIATNVSIVAGESIEVSHEFKWAAGDPPTMRIGENRVRWFLEVMVDPCTEPSITRRIPINVGTRLVGPSTVVATEISHE